MDKIFELIKKEEQRQEQDLNLIASENYVSKEVLRALGSVLTNKYSEGYPKKRYYAGNEIIDEVEEVARKRAMELFEIEWANVQPHSGSTANFAAYMAVLEPGDKIMGMELSHGGHLTHGSKVNFSGKFYNFLSYGVEENGFLDYDKIEQMAKKERPKAILAGYTAYPRKVDFKRFREIADEIGAYLIADISHISGLIAGKVHETANYADIITSTTHKTLRGPRGAIILCHEELKKKVDKAVFPGSQGGPLEHVIAAKAIAFKEAMTEEFKQYAKQIVKNSKRLAEELKNRGFKLVSGGTDNHLILIDLTNKGITGKEAQNILEKNRIIANRNTIPFDKQSPFVTSGVRIGTAAVTTRGMKEEQMSVIAELIDRALKGEDVKKEVLMLTAQFPIY